MSRVFLDGAISKKSTRRGLPPIPQMEGTVSLPKELWSYTLQGDKITRIMVHGVPGGGIQGLLHQLGIDVPIIQ